MQKTIFKIIGIVSAALVGLTAAPAQRLKVEVAQKREGDGISSWWYVLILVMAVALLAVVLEWFKKKKSEKKVAAKFAQKRKLENLKSVAIDADRETEWARKKSKSNRRKSRKRAVIEELSENFSEVYEGSESHANLENVLISENKNPAANTPLPVFEIKRVERARPFVELPVSNDEALLNAIEQVSEEFEEDTELRELALKILTAFKTQSSVEAISQVALYDLSASLRSKAVSVLADFDHESVFETLLLACADPAREVRAAAARGLFRLSFERKEAWLRITEFDKGRRRQCARALIAGDLVTPSLERLTHPDRNYSSEAFAVAVLLVKSGETDEIFQMLKNHSDPNLKKAILHIIKLAGEPGIFEELSQLRENYEFTGELCEEIDRVLENAGLTVACV